MNRIEAGSITTCQCARCVQSRMMCVAPRCKSDGYPTAQLPSKSIAQQFVSNIDDDRNLSVAIEDAVARLTAAMELLAKSMAEYRNG